MKISVKAEILSAGSLSWQDRMELQIFVENEGCLIFRIDRSEEGLTALETLISHAVLCHRSVSSDIGKPQRYGAELIR